MWGLFAHVFLLCLSCLSLRVCDMRLVGRGVVLQVRQTHSLLSLVHCALVCVAGVGCRVVSTLYQVVLCDTAYLVLPVSSRFSLGTYIPTLHLVESCVPVWLLPDFFLWGLSNECLAVPIVWMSLFSPSLLACCKCVSCSPTCDWFASFLASFQLGENGCTVSGHFLRVEAQFAL